MWLLKLLSFAVQETMEVLKDAYQPDVYGESTPDVIVSEFVCILSLDHFICFLAFSRIIHMFIDRRVCECVQ